MSLKRLKINILTAISIVLIRIIGRIPDKIMIFKLRLLNKLAKNFKFEVLGFFFKDVLDVYEKGKPYTDIVRRILLESTNKELKYVLEGLFDGD